MKRATTISLGNLTSYRYGEESYNADRLGIGFGMCQKTGPNPQDKWAGPLPLVHTHPYDLGVATQYCGGIDVIQWSDTPTSKIDWVLAFEFSSRTGVFHIWRWVYDRITGDLAFGGRIQIAGTANDTLTCRGMRASLERYTTGSASVSGTAVTGTGTGWQTARMCAGSRIGFGSTDPTAITSWYQISAIGSDTSITLTESVSAVDGPYVIEDFRLVLAVLDGTTATNGGVLLVKGLRPELFRPDAPANNAAFATNADNVRASYWLKSASTITETALCGCALEPRVDWQTQYVWVINHLTNSALYKFNIRKNLTVSSGADTTAFVLNTGVSPQAFSSQSSQQVLFYAAANHGPSPGQGCLYRTGHYTLPVMRTSPVSQITQGDLGWANRGDIMGYIAPVGSTAYYGYTASSFVDSFVYISQLDKFLLTQYMATATKMHISEYRAATNQPYDRSFGGSNAHYTQTGADASYPPNLVYPSPNILMKAGASGAVVFISHTNQANNTGFYVAPLVADWEYASTTNARLVLPRMLTPNALSYGQVIVTCLRLMGGDQGHNLGLPPEPYRVYYRTSGISDNSGAWTLLDNTGRFTADGMSSLQLMMEFRTIGLHCLPSQIYSVTLCWTDNGGDEHFQFVPARSNAPSRQYVWRHSTAFGSTVPALKVMLLDADTNEILLTDTTTSHTYGTFERSTDGSSWSAWINTDKTNATTYIRYTATAQTGTHTVQASLMLA